MKKITDKAKIKMLEHVIEDTFWMARRYANGRHTYAPSMVRDAYKILKQYFPHMVPKKDVTLTAAPESEMLKGCRFVDDYLTDINEDPK